VEITDATIDRLVEAASRARAAAYAPYSGFAVGAAVLTDDGSIFTGANVENASYGLSVCAERHAIGTAVGNGHRSLVALAVVTSTTPPSSPCGACRQVITEFGPMAVILANLEGARIVTGSEELLPMAFTPRSLGT